MDIILYFYSTFSFKFNSVTVSSVCSLMATGFLTQIPVSGINAFGRSEDVGTIRPNRWR